MSYLNMKISKQIIYIHLLLQQKYVYLKNWTKLETTDLKNTGIQTAKKTLDIYIWVLFDKTTHHKTALKLETYKTHIPLNIYG